MSKRNKKETQNGREKVKISLVTQIVWTALLPLVVIAVILTIVGGSGMQNGMRYEIIDKLKALVVSTQGAFAALDSGDYTLDEEGNILKGEYNLTENTDVLDSLVDGLDEDLTLFYDNTRRATTLFDKNTNERILGTTASDEVYETVVKNGKTYQTFDIEINDTPYYAYYAPMKNADGTVVGMFFAGAPATEVNSYISAKVRTLVLTSVIGAILAIIVIALALLPMRKGIMETNAAVVNFAAGDLTAEIGERALKRSDELGVMAREVKQLRDELIEILSKVKDSSSVLMDSGKELSTMASQTSTTADEISHAVEDISKGAVSQAEDIEMASDRINEMGSVIGRIVESVGALDKTSGEMKTAGDKSSDIIKDLSRSNDKTMEAIDRIGKQVNATNESANKISEAIEIITSIAEETNLLSLNASIEAARAGEQGRGFAVVANQIQKLAEQSNESAQKIASIIQDLLEDSEHTVAVMSEVQQIVNEQQEKLKQTKNQFGEVSKGIEVSRDETSGIKEQTAICDNARTNVVDVISSLSAISEENAASTQETTASMQELNATMNLLAEAAGNLTELSESLEQKIQFFHF